MKRTIAYSCKTTPGQAKLLFWVLKVRLPWMSRCVAHFCWKESCQNKPSEASTSSTSDIKIFGCGWNFPHGHDVSRWCCWWRKPLTMYWKPSPSYCMYINRITSKSMWSSRNLVHPKETNALQPSCSHSPWGSKKITNVYNRCSNSSSPYVFRWYVLSLRYVVIFRRRSGRTILRCVPCPWLWMGDLEKSATPTPDPTVEAKDAQKSDLHCDRTEKSPGPFRNFRKRAGFCVNYTH